jgi:hypothetical protein
MRSALCLQSGLTSERWERQFAPAGARMCDCDMVAKHAPAVRQKTTDGDEIALWISH